MKSCGFVQVAALVEALRLSAPNTENPDDGLYSDWKIKWENILRWSKGCTDFLDHFRAVTIEDGAACGRALLSGERVVIEDVPVIRSRIRVHESRDMLIPV